MTLAAKQFSPTAGGLAVPGKGTAAVLLGELQSAYPELVRFARFLLLGGLAAGVNWLSRFGWSLIAPFELAVILAHATGMAVAFVTFRAFVFPGSPLPAAVQMTNFVLVNLVGMGVAFVTAVGLARVVFPAVGFTFHAEAIAHGIAVLSPVLTSWIGHRRLSFAGGR